MNMFSHTKRYTIKEYKYVRKWIIVNECTMVYESSYEHLIIIVKKKWAIVQIRKIIGTNINASFLLEIMSLV